MSPFDEREPHLFVHEAHLDVDLGELRLTVSTQIFVTEAARDLKVFFHPADHEQLLIDLRGLRRA